MLKNFADKKSERLWNNEFVKEFQSIESTALRKLKMMEAASGIDVLRVIPGNRLEALKGDSSGQFSIRINDQYRICFSVNGDEFSDVEITDYH